MHKDIKDCVDLYREEMRILEKRFPERLSTMHGATSGVVGQGLHEITWAEGNAGYPNTTLCMNFYALMASRYSGPLTLISEAHPAIDRQFWGEKRILTGRLLSIGISHRKIPLVADTISGSEKNALIGIISSTTFPSEFLAKMKSLCLENSLAILIMRPSHQSMLSQRRSFDSRWSLHSTIAYRSDQDARPISLIPDVSLDAKKMLTV